MAVDTADFRAVGIGDTAEFSRSLGYCVFHRFPFMRAVADIIVRADRRSLGRSSNVRADGSDLRRVRFAAAEFPSVADSARIWGKATRDDRVHRAHSVSGSHVAARGRLWGRSSRVVSRRHGEP